MCINCTINTVQETDKMIKSYKNWPSIHFAKVVERCMGIHSLDSEVKQC